MNIIGRSLSRLKVAAKGYVAEYQCSEYAAMMKMLNYQYDGSISYYTRRISHRVH